MSDRDPFWYHLDTYADDIARHMHHKLLVHLLTRIRNESADFEVRTAADNLLHLHRTALVHQFRDYMLHGDQAKVPMLHRRWFFIVALHTDDALMRSLLTDIAQTWNTQANHNEIALAAQRLLNAADDNCFTAMRQQATATFLTRISNTTQETRS